MSASTELMLGTAQFSLEYGFLKKKARHVASILDCAWDLGIRWMDSSPVYGDTEQNLKVLFQKHSFNVISKIPPIQHDDKQARNFILEKIDGIQNTLGESLRGLLFHPGSDLLSPKGAYYWEVAERACTMLGVKIGLSCYCPQEALEAVSQFPITMAQIPSNVFDQRLNFSEVKGVDVHVRSVFLQGVLLQSKEVVSRVLPQIGPCVGRWEAWCQENGMTPLIGALSFVKSLPNVHYCIVGVEEVLQLEEIYYAWQSAKAMDMSSLAISEANIIDPRLW